jgi:TolA-binding protein
MAKQDRYTAPRQVMNPTTATPLSDEEVGLVSANERLEKIESVYQSNKKNINIGLGALAALIIGFFAYKLMVKGPNETKAADALGRPSTYMLMDSLNFMMNGQNGELGTKKIADKFSGTKAGNLASYMSGVGSLRQGNFKDAIKYLKAYEPNGTLVDALAEGCLGDAYWENNQLAEAASAYEKAGADDKNIQFSPMYLMRAGMVYEQLKNNDKAINVYKMVKEKFPQSNSARETEKSLARLGVIED